MSLGQFHWMSAVQTWGPSLAGQLHLCSCKPLSPALLWGWNGNGLLGITNQHMEQRWKGFTHLSTCLGATQSIARTIPGSWSRSFCCQERSFVFTSCSAFTGCCFKYLRKTTDAMEGRREYITCVQEQQLLFRTPISAFSTSVAKWQCLRRDKSPTQGRLQPYRG